MMEHMEYKGYLGSVEVDMSDYFAYGRLMFIRDVVSYRADDLKSIRTSFEQAVDDYLSTCAELGDAPDVPCKGTFNVRIGPELHQQLAILAAKEKVSLNDWVRQACTLKANQSNADDQTGPKKSSHMTIEASFSDEVSFDLGGNGDWPPQNPNQPQLH